MAEDSIRGQHPWPCVQVTVRDVITGPLPVPRTVGKAHFLGIPAPQAPTSLLPQKDICLATTTKTNKQATPTKRKEMNAI